MKGTCHITKKSCSAWGNPIIFFWERDQSLQVLEWFRVRNPHELSCFTLQLSACKPSSSILPVLHKVTKSYHLKTIFKFKTRNYILVTDKFFLKKRKNASCSKGRRQNKNHRNFKSVIRTFLICPKLSLFFIFAFPNKCP